jgi:hypothetical protein
MSKYGLAKQVILDLESAAQAAGIDTEEAEEALLVSLVQTLKASLGADYVRGTLQYELDSLGSGGVHEIARGGGHS